MESFANNPSGMIAVYRIFSFMFVCWDGIFDFQGSVSAQSNDEFHWISSKLKNPEFGKIGLGNAAISTQTATNSDFSCRPIFEERLVVEE